MASVVAFSVGGGSDDDDGVLSVGCSDQPKAPSPEGSSSQNPERFRFDEAESRVASPPIMRFHWKKLGGPIGQGRYGTVYKVVREDTGQFLAAKLCSVEEVRTPSPSSDRSNSTNAKIISALKKEVAILAQLEHVNIVKFVGYDRSFSYFSLFFEFMPGGSLRTYLDKNGPLKGPGDRKIRAFLKQAVTALQYLHKHDIVHRDIKAANLLLDLKLQHIKLCDFGEAKRLHQDLSARAERSLSGSPLWMAPEVIRQEIHADDASEALNANADAWKRADVWSVGCTMVEMHTGKTPWDNMKSVPAAFLHIASSNEPPPLPGHVHQNAKSFLEACCARKAALRFDTTKLLEHVYIYDPQELLVSPAATGDGDVPTMGPRNVSPVVSKNDEDRSTAGDDVLSQLEVPVVKRLVLPGRSLSFSDNLYDDDYDDNYDEDDSETEYNDFPTPRPLTASSGGSSNPRSPLPFVPTLDIKRALSDSATGLNEKVSKRTLAQSSFLKKASKLGGGAWRPRSRSGSVSASAIEKDINTFVNHGHRGDKTVAADGIEKRMSVVSVSRKLSSSKAAHAEKEETMARLNIRVIHDSLDEGKPGEKFSNGISDIIQVNVAPSKTGNSPLKMKKMKKKKDRGKDDKMVPDNYTKYYLDHSELGDELFNDVDNDADEELGVPSLLTVPSPMSASRRRHTWGSSTGRKSAIRQVREDAQATLRIMNFSSASERDNVSGSESSDGSLSSRSSRGTPRDRIVQIKNASLGVPVLTLNKTPRWYNQPRPSSPGSIRTASTSSDEESSFGLSSRSSLEFPSPRVDSFLRPRSASNSVELSPLGGEGQSRTFFDEALARTVNLQGPSSLVSLDNSDSDGTKSSSLSRIRATSQSSNSSKTDSIAEFDLSNVLMKYGADNEEQVDDFNKEQMHDLNKAETQEAKTIVIHKKPMITDVHCTILSMWLAQARYICWDKEWGDAWREWNTDLARDVGPEIVALWEGSDDRDYRGRDLEKNAPGAEYPVYEGSFDVFGTGDFYYTEQADFKKTEFDDESQTLGEEVGNFWAYALQDYTGDNAGELSFLKNDWIWIVRGYLSYNEDTWWEGIVNSSGETGWLLSSAVNWETLDNEKDLKPPDEYIDNDGIPGRDFSLDDGEEWWNNSQYLFYSIKSGDIDWVRWFLDTAQLSVNCLDDEGNTPLIFAASCGSKKMVKLLLRRQADIDRQNYAGYTVLHASFLKGHNKLGKYLIKKGADPLIRDNEGRTCHDILEAIAATTTLPLSVAEFVQDL